MRISQLQNICWAANGVVLLGVGFVVMQFVETYKERGRIAEVEWPETEKKGIDRRWPGDVRAFTEIWETPVNGVVPPPPDVPVEEVATIAPEEQFKKDFEYVSGILFLGAPHRSTAEIRYRPASPADTKTIGLGDLLAGSPKGDKWQFIAFFHDPAIQRKVLMFRNQKLGKLVRMEEPEKPPVSLTAPAPSAPLPPGIDPKADFPKPTVEVDRIVPAAWPHHEYPNLDRWIVPQAELEWWERFGEEEVLAKLQVKEHADESGVSRGLKIMSEPGDGTPVESGRGIIQGDVIKSVNGVPIRSLADIVRFLRGEGRGLDRYEVLVESKTGLERTVTYEIRRRRS